MSDEQDREYGLVMPFVTVASKGGPHDDEAYTCGYEMGLLEAFLEAEEPATYEGTIHASNRGQADLIGMRHQYTARFEDTDYPEWITVTLDAEQVLQPRVLRLPFCLAWRLDLGVLQHHRACLERPRGGRCRMNILTDTETAELADRIHTKQWGWKSAFNAWYLVHGDPPSFIHQNPPRQPARRPR